MDKPTIFKSCKKLKNENSKKIVRLIQILALGIEQNTLRERTRDFLEERSDPTLRKQVEDLLEDLVEEPIGEQAGYLLQDRVEYQIKNLTYF